MKDELAEFYRCVASSAPLRNRIRLTGLSAAILSMLVGREFEWWRIGGYLNGYMLGILAGTVIVACAHVYCRKLNEEVRIGQIRFLHRRRGEIEVELGAGDTWREDRRSIARWTRELGDRDWRRLNLFIRTAVFPEAWLIRQGFVLRRSTGVLQVSGVFAYSLKWLRWAAGRWMKRRRAPRYRQDGYVEGEQELGPCLDAVNLS